MILSILWSWFNVGVSNSVNTILLNFKKNHANIDFIYIVRCIVPTFNHTYKMNSIHFVWNKNDLIPETGGAGEHSRGVSNTFIQLLDIVDR